VRSSLPALLAAVAAVGCGCGATLQTPTVTPRAATVTSVSAGGLAMRIEMAIQNPNDTELRVRSIRAHVTAQGQDLGTVDTASELRLPGGQETPLAADVAVPWRSVPSLGLGAVLGGSIPYHVEGTVTVAGPAGITLEVPFEMDGQLPSSMLIQLPGLR
jgi:hypothetical protein